MTKLLRTKHLMKLLPKQSGRDNQGHVAVRHQGGRHKRFYRLVDFKRDKYEVVARVTQIEYDPNRTADIALLTYADGEKRYILAPENLKIGDEVRSGQNAEVKTGNALPLSHMPVGTMVHNIELTPGKGAKLMRSAGSVATVLAKEGGWVHIKLPSGEIRRVTAGAMATVGQIGNIDHRHQRIGKAGRARRMGRRPTVRGVAQNPRSHPHGGGEGRSGIGMSSPKSPWGRTVGRITRKRTKYSNHLILQKRKNKK